MTTPTQAPERPLPPLTAALRALSAARKRSASEAGRREVERLRLEIRLARGQQ